MLREILPYVRSFAILILTFTGGDTMRDISKSQVAGFFVVGAAVGAVAALLFAPKSGVQIRKDIRRISRRTMDQLDDLQSDIREQITDGYEQVKNMIKTA
jgi:gas vesicle protein